MEDKKQLAEKLLGWIKTQSSGIPEVEEYKEENSQGLRLKTEYATGQVNIIFLQYTIVEYRINNDKDENVFYLHFELNDIEHAKELFTEMKDCLLKQRGSETKHVLLCCSCGLTTSYFTMRLNEVAQVLDAKMDFEAVPYEMLYEKAKEKDAILIAPQIGYQLKNVQSVLKDKVVLTVPVQIFSQYDGAGMINLLNETFAGKTEKKSAEKTMSIGSLSMQNGSVLIVSVIYMEGRNQIAYRIYDHGEITAENQITKETYQFSDILDVIQLVNLMNPNLEKICIVTPGMVHDGKLTYERANIVDLDVSAHIEKQFGKKVYLFNDADMIALGYSRTEREGKDAAFYFLPTGNYAGNIGIVVNGNLIGGAKHMGGRQLEGVTGITTFPQNPYTLMRTPEGNIELMARYLTGLFSYTGIDHIAFYSSMIPETEPLKEKMASLIPEQYLPEVVKVESVRNFLYQGVLHSIEE